MGSKRLGGDYQPQLGVKIRGTQNWVLNWVLWWILNRFFTSNQMLEAVYCPPVSHGPPWRVPGGKEVINSLKTEESHQRQGEIPPSLFLSCFVSKLRLEMNSCHFMAPNYDLQVTPIECPTGSLENNRQPLTLDYWWKKWSRIHYNSQFCVPLMCFFHVLMEARIETLPPWDCLLASLLLLWWFHETWGSQYLIFII